MEDLNIIGIIIIILLLIIGLMAFIFIDNPKEENTKKIPSINLNNLDNKTTLEIKPITPNEKTSKKIKILKYS